MHAKDRIMPRYAELIYNGYWFSKERLVLQKIIDQKRSRVEGEVTIKLYKGNMFVAGRKSKKNVYSLKKSSFESGKIFSKKYVENMGWDDLNWLEDVHMGYEENRPAVFCRNANGWVTIPKKIKLPNNQQDRDMIARELLVKFQMSPKHPLVDLKKAYRKF